MIIKYKKIVVCALLLFGLLVNCFATGEAELQFIEDPNLVLSFDNTKSKFVLKFESGFSEINKVMFEIGFYLMFRITYEDGGCTMQAFRFANIFREPEFVKYDSKDLKKGIYLNHISETFFKTLAGKIESLELEKLKELELTLSFSDMTKTDKKENIERNAPKIKLSKEEIFYAFKIYNNPPKRNSFAAKKTAITFVK